MDDSVLRIIELRLLFYQCWTSPAWRWLNIMNWVCESFSAWRNIFNFGSSSLKWPVSFSLLFIFFSPYTTLPSNSFTGTSRVKAEASSIVSEHNFQWALLTLQHSLCYTLRRPCCRKTAEYLARIFHKPYTNRYCWVLFELNFAFNQSERYI